MAAEQAIVPAKKAARTVGSNEEELNPLPKSVSIVATINPVRKTIKDLFTRMYTNTGHHDRRETNADQHDRRQDWEGGIRS